MYSTKESKVNVSHNERFKALIMGIEASNVMNSVPQTGCFHGSNSTSLNLLTDEATNPRTGSDELELELAMYITLQGLSKCSSPHSGRII